MHSSISNSEKTSDSLCDFVTKVTIIFEPLVSEIEEFELQELFSKRDFGQSQFLILLCTSCIGAESFILQDQSSF